MEDDLNKIREKKMRDYLTNSEQNKAQSPGKKPVQISDEEFDEFVGKNQKVVVDCYADWCMPCRMVSPIIEELAREMDGVAFAKLNVDYNQNVAMRYGIMSIPTILLFKDGKLVDQVIGAMPKSALKSRIERSL